MMARSALEVDQMKRSYYGFGEPPNISDVSHISTQSLFNVFLFFSSKRKGVPPGNSSVTLKQDKSLSIAHLGYTGMNVPLDSLSFLKENVPSAAKMLCP